MSITDLRAAAVDAVLDHQWSPSLKHSAHRLHDFDSSCAVCSGDVAKILGVALKSGAIDPRLLRWCEWPGCFAWYDATTGPVGDQGWTRHHGLTVLCPPHTRTGHAPRCSVDLTDLSSLPASCSCGVSKRVRPANWDAAFAWWTAHVLALPACTE